MGILVLKVFVKMFDVSSFETETDSKTTSRLSKLAVGQIMLRLEKEF